MVLRSLKDTSQPGAPMGTPKTPGDYCMLAENFNALKLQIEKEKKAKLEWKKKYLESSAEVQILEQNLLLSVNEKLAMASKLEELEAQMEKQQLRVKISKYVGMAGMIFFIGSCILMGPCQSNANGFNIKVKVIL